MLKKFKLSKYKFKVLKYEFKLSKYIFNKLPGLQLMVPGKT